MSAQHGSLTQERWAAFSLDQQILMIANEMNRASKMLRPEDLDALRNGYERVLSLADLTLAIHSRRTLRRELLRWRDLVAALYISELPQPDAHAAAFLALLRFTPAASEQISHVVLGHDGPR